MSRKQIRLKAECKEKKNIGIEFLDDHKEKTEVRYQNLLRKADMIYCTVRDDLRKAAESFLPKGLLDRNFMDFVCNGFVSDESLEELSVPKRTSENAIDITSDAVSAFESLSIPVDKASVANEVMELESARSPLQENSTFSNVPSVIRPKVEDLRARNFRPARDGEVAFSLDGSPIVVLPNVSNDPASVAFKQIVEDYKAFSPNTREVVSTFKLLMRKKMSEAQKLDPQLD